LQVHFIYLVGCFIAGQAGPREWELLNKYGKPAMPQKSVLMATNCNSMAAPPHWPCGALLVRFWPAFGPLRARFRGFLGRLRQRVGEHRAALLI